VHDLLHPGDDTGHIGGDLFVAVQEVLQVDIGAQVVGTEVTAAMNAFAASS